MELLILTVWIISGIAGLGWTYGYFQGKWPTLAEDHRGGDRMFAMVVGIIGPVGILVVMLNRGYAYGWKPIWK